MVSGQVARPLVMKYILNEAVREIDQMTRKICRLFANLQLPAATAVTRSRQDIGIIERWDVSTNSSPLFHGGIIPLMPLSA